MRLLSDDDLVKEGKQLRSLCGGVVSAGPSWVFDIELRICRESIGAGTRDERMKVRLRRDAAMNLFVRPEEAVRAFSGYENFRIHNCRDNLRSSR